MLLKDHEAFVIDLDEVSSEFSKSLITGIHWDEEIIAIRPDLGQKDLSRLAYTLENHPGLEKYKDLDDPETHDAISEWSKRRAVSCYNKLGSLELVPLGDSPSNLGILASRMIGCEVDDLRKELGIFWTFDFDNWPDHYPLWSEHGRGGPVLLVTALLPVNRINWKTSLMRLMDWMLGDCEAELRVYKDTCIKVISCKDLHTEEDLYLPPISWQT